MKSGNPYIFTELEDQRHGFPFNLCINEIAGSYGSHRHLFLEFSYVIEGIGKEIINGKTHTIKPGTFTLILPYQIHELHSNKDTTLKLYNCSMPMDAFFGANRIGDELNRILFMNDGELSPYVCFDGEKAVRALRIIKEMETEYESNQLWSTLMFKSKLAEILVLFDRERKTGLTGAASESVKTNKNRIWDVLYYIFRNYAENISLDSLSSQFYTNSSYLSTQFKKYFGTNIKNFIDEIRVLHTCSLLSSTDLPISRIAFDVGFKSYSSFCRVFHKIKGMSAAEYRKLFRMENDESE